MFQNEIEREQPPNHDLAVRLSPVADMLDPQRPVDRLAGYPARLGSPGEHKGFVLHRLTPLHQCLDKAQRTLAIRIEVVTELIPPPVPSIRIVPEPFPADANVRSWAACGYRSIPLADIGALDPHVWSRTVQTTMGFLQIALGKWM